MWGWSRIVAAPLLFIAPLAGSAPAGAPLWSYRVVAEYPHDPAAFTEGLAMLNGRLLESTGRYGESRLILRDLTRAAPIAETPLPAQDFGEGATVVGGRIAQLTWQSGVGYLYDFDLKRRGRFNYAGEGWGLTFDGENLIRSDGSATLHFFSPHDYLEVRALKVHDGKAPVPQLNELEWARGRVYANVWHSSRIAVIAPEDGRVLAWIDLGALEKRLAKPAGWNPQDNVLNGIAYDPVRGHFYVTGKCWPKLFEIAVDEAGMGQ